MVHSLYHECVWDGLLVLESRLVAVHVHLLLQHVCEGGHRSHPGWGGLATRRASPVDDYPAGMDVDMVSPCQLERSCGMVLSECRLLGGACQAIQP